MGLERLTDDGLMPETLERVSLKTQYPNFGELQNETNCIRWRFYRRI